MIRVTLKPEPATFNDAVRVPGNLFLKNVTHPTKEQWDANRFWTLCLSDLYSAYDGICSYTSMWIPNTYNNRTVDHFFPKSTHQNLAYEWSNYRLSCQRANNNKQNLEVLDPLGIENGWFHLVFPSLLIIPNPDLLADLKNNIKKTIDILRLNDQYFIDGRLSWIRQYADDYDINNLRRFAPFLAYEIERQDAQQLVREMLT